MLILYVYQIVYKNAIVQLVDRLEVANQIMCDVSTLALLSHSLLLASPMPG